MNTRLTVGIITVIAILLGIFVFVNLAGGSIENFFSPLFTQKGTLSIDGHAFTVYVAKTEQQKETGLSGQKSIGQNQGMVFLFTTADYYGFWMKNMKFPLDIIFIRNNKIVTIFPDLPYPQDQTSSLPIYMPTQPADMVLEVNAGTSKKDNFAVGDSVTTTL